MGRGANLGADQIQLAKVRSIRRVLKTFTGGRSAFAAKPAPEAEGRYGRREEHPLDCIAHIPSLPGKGSVRI